VARSRKTLQSVLDLTRREEAVTDDETDYVSEKASRSVGNASPMYMPGSYGKNSIRAPSSTHRSMLVTMAHESESTANVDAADKRS